MRIRFLRDLAKLAPQAVTKDFWGRTLGQLSIADLNFQYPATAGEPNGFALRNVSFSCPIGKVTCLIGPSGSGKSTVLKLISGQLLPDRGSLYFGEVDLFGVKFGQRGTATVHQDFALLPYLTVYENISMGPRVAGTMDTSLREEILEWAALFRMTEFLDRAVSTLSGGERQRVAILRALAARPNVLLMDEPTASLDMISKDQLAATILSLKRAATKIVVLIVTHDRDFGLRTADKMGNR